MTSNNTTIKTRSLSSIYRHMRAMAFRLKERLPSSIDFNDLVSIGTEELIKLARRYESALNDSFWGYAKMRVNGAMLDYLRSLDVISRSSRKLIKSIDIEITKYLNEHGKEPSDAYLAEALGENIEKIREAKTYLRYLCVSANR